MDEKPPFFPFRRRATPSRKLCPLCLGRLQTTSPLGGWLIPEEYVCERCGYVGAVALEPAEEKM